MAPYVTDILGDNFEVVAVVLRTQRHLVATFRMPASQPNEQEPDPNIHAYAHQLLRDLDERDESVDATLTAPAPTSNVVVRTLATLAKYAPPVSVAYVTACCREPLAFLAFVQMACLFLTLCKYSTPEIGKISSSYCADAITVTTRDVSFLQHSRLLRTVPSSTIRTFRAALSFSVLTPGTSTPFGFHVGRIATQNHYLEVVNLQEQVVLNDFPSHYTVAEIAMALNDALHQWRLMSNIAPPLDVFGTQGTDNDASKKMSKSISHSIPLPSHLPHSDRFSVRSLGNHQIRCDIRRSAEQQEKVTCILLFAFFLILLFSTSKNVTVTHSDREVFFFGRLRVGVTRNSYSYKVTMMRLSGPLLRGIAIVCSGLFSLWWTQLYKQSTIRMESFTFTYNTTSDIFSFPKSILALFTGRFVINVRDVSAMQVFRNSSDNAAQAYRRDDCGNDFISGPRYGLRLFRRSGRRVFQIDKLSEGEALYLAHCLRTAHPHICEVEQ